jgi:hypothetical protein
MPMGSLGETTVVGFDPKNPVTVQALSKKIGPPVGFSWYFNIMCLQFGIDTRYSIDGV